MLPVKLQTGTNKKFHREGWNFIRAEDETRTRDPHLGKVMLYQLSYFRMYFKELFVPVWDCKDRGGKQFYKYPLKFFFQPDISGNCSIAQ